MKKSNQFPFKLYQMLEDAGDKGFDDVISWTSDGKAFQIFDKDKLTAILPLYMHSGRFKSFQRSLNLWGFSAERAKASTSEGGNGNSNGNSSSSIHSSSASLFSSRRSHPQFLRGKPDLCHEMERVRVKEPGARKTAGKKKMMLLSKAAAATSSPIVSTTTTTKTSGTTTLPQEAQSSLSAASKLARLDFELKQYQAQSQAQTQRLQEEMSALIALRSHHRQRNPIIHQDSMNLSKAALLYNGLPLLSNHNNDVLFNSSASAANSNAAANATSYLTDLRSRILASELGLASANVNALGKTTNTPSSPFFLGSSMDINLDIERERRRMQTENKSKFNNNNTTNSSGRFGLQVLLEQDRKRQQQQQQHQHQHPG